jgi:transposase
MDFVVGHPLPNTLSDLKSLVLVLLGRLDALEQANTSLQAENAALRAENAALKMHQNRLESEVSDLRHRLGLTSKNSHKPPSSDGLQKAPAFPKASGRKAGGQTGHPGKTLSLVATPDAVIIHRPLTCTCCGELLAELPLSHTVGRRQLFELPAPRLIVTEHQLGVVRCCGQPQTGVFPPYVTAPVQYGARVKALCTLLSTDYRMPYQKISVLFADLFAYRLNESTIFTANKALSDALVPVETAIKAVIAASPVVHFDETGMRVAGKLHWFHTASTPKWTYLFCHSSRGKEALDSPQSVLATFQNWAIHDCWQTYFTYTACDHGLCGAHLLRELTALQEGGRRWADEMKKWLLSLYEKSRKGTQVVADRAKWEQQYQKICAKAAQEEPLPAPKKPGQRGRVAQSKGRNLLKRLVENQAGVLAFAFVKEVPFTNNQAERDIRCVKIKQKIAMSFRQMDGANVYARIQGFVSSARKNGLQVMQQILQVFQGEKLDWINAS